MKKTFFLKEILFLLFFVWGWTCFSGSSQAAVRIKEIAQFEGARENQLMGYGLVVGLNGTGDKGKSVFTVRSIANMLQRLGMDVNSQEISVKNVAAVMITATLPPFVRNGTKIDVTLSSLGDAKSLAGGILLQAPLQAPDGQVYAVAQGAVSIGGMSGGGDKDVFGTVARIPDGALVEKEVPVQLMKDGFVTLQLFNNDFTTSARAAEAINLLFGEILAYPVDGGTIKVRVPQLFEYDLVKFVSKIERIEIVPDYKSRIIVNERTGTIVGGKEVRITKASLSHNDISIEIQAQKNEEEEEANVQPLSSLGQFDEALFREDEENTVPDNSGEISVGELAQYLNSLGVRPKDLVAILQSMRASNAIQAEIVII